MLPGAIVTLEALPLMPNGKIDLSRLPEPEPERFENEGEFIRPRTAIEVSIAHIWCEVLGLLQVGIHDNFFKLGGHPILTFKVMARLREKYNVAVPLRSFFETPTVAWLSDFLEQAPDENQQHFESPTITVSGERAVPLSFSQQRLWFLNQLEPGCNAYNVFISLHLYGQLSIEVLEESFKEIIQRHEVLRTTFTTEGDEPVQSINQNVSFNIQKVDLCKMSASQRDEELINLAQKESSHHFDLTSGLLLRVSVVSLEQDEHMLLLTIHHIVCDAWSMGLLLRELSVLYDSFLQGASSPIQERPLQFAEFSLRQRQWLRGERLKKQIRFWEEHLRDITVLELPTDHGRPAIQSFRGKKHIFQLPKSLTEAIQELSNKEHVTLFMTLLSAFQSMLHRYTGQSDIVVGTPIANRNLANSEKSIGFFLNTLVIRSDLSGNPSFRELLLRVRNNLLDAYDHQDLPFEKLVEELQPDRYLDRNPLFQVLFTLQDSFVSNLQLSGLAVSPIEFEYKNTRFDLEFHFVREPESLRGAFIYNTDLFDDATIERMASHYQRIVEGIVSNPDHRLSELPLLRDPERHQLLQVWNKTAVDYPRDKCMHELFQDQVGTDPEAIAASFEKDTLTYRELNNKANQLAHYLRREGVAPDVLVSVCLERSLNMVICVLGILKAGGAYVPLDPTYPKERLQFMLNDSGSPVFLTEKTLSGELLDNKIRRICLDSAWEEIEKESIQNLSETTSPENLAYVLYTSGSTGRPKGVAMQHRSLCNLISWQINNSNLSYGAKTLQFASLSFDVSFQEIFSTLCSGGNLIVLPGELHRDPVALLHHLEEESIQRLFLPFVALQQLAEVADQHDNFPLSLQEVITAGEQLQITPSIASMFEKLRNCRLYNQYGPTESHVVTVFQLTGLPGEWPSLPSIGRPIANSEIYILDKYHQPLPVGVAGELYIGGDCIAREYLNQPELTLEKFIPNPFSSGRAERLYKTGDLAKYSPNGNIEYLGRLDHQLKVRGFRIEPGEIEAALVKHDFIREAIVTVRPDEAGNNRLIAYVIINKKSKFINKQLRSYLMEILPEYMVPSTFVVLDSLPLTPSGKVDRKTLPVPEIDRSELDTGFVEPKAHFEIELATIWSDVLGLSRVGVNDNFFDLGGHSLMATKITTRILDRFDIKAPLRVIFEHPTIFGQAEYLEREFKSIQKKKHKQEIVDVLSKSHNSQVDDSLIIPHLQDKHDLPLSFAQQRLFFLERLIPGTSLYNISYSICLIGELNKEALCQGFNKIIQRHEILRTIFKLKNGQPIQAVEPTVIIDIPVIDLGDLADTDRETEVKKRVAQEAQKPFELDKGPLVRAKLLQTSRQEHILILTLHHIIFDGWSMSVLKRELSILYSAFKADNPSPLPDLPIQYSDFIVWQQRQLSDIFDTQLAFWRKTLEDLPVLQLPVDFPRPVQQSYRGARYSFELPAALTTRLINWGLEYKCSSFMTLLSVFSILMSRYTDQEDIGIGTPITIRNRANLEKLIGFFVNTLVLRVDLSGNPSFKELIQRVQGIALDAYDNRDLPFEKLVAELRPEQDMSRNPFFQSMFTLNNISNSDLKLEDLTVNSFMTSSDTAKFDLTFSLLDTGEGFTGQIEYNTDLFTSTTIERLVGHFQMLLAGIVEDPEQSIAKLPLLSAAEQHQLLVEWNETRKDYPRDQCIHQLFEKQAELSPDAVAVIYGNFSLTYGELNRHANQLAHFLLGHDVSSGSILGICMERSVEMIVGLLAILKVGGAYVPLDPEYPKERLDFMLKDAGISVLLTQAALADCFSGIGLLCVDCDLKQNTFASESIDNPTTAGKPNDLAYVIYTSGSTGIPKGVCVSHRAVNKLIHDTNYIDLKASDNIAQASNASFDAATFEIWGALLNGGRLVGISRETLLSPYLLAKQIRSHKITTLFLTTALFNQFAREKPCLFSSLRHVLFGGEAVTHKWVEAVLQAGGPARLLHVYGPTECTTFATWHLVEQGVNKTGVIPIGRPISNTMAYILDKLLQPVPIGIPGELYLGGEGLADGYLNRPDLTSERFVANPFSERPGACMYRTGDLVRSLPDGNIVFLDRIDQQVKIRGFRIELGEIESVLLKHPVIDEVIVVAITGNTKDKQLVAYVVANIKRELLQAELQSYLREKLPDYMVPSFFMFLDRLPMTPNGKVDRRLLPAPAIDDERVGKRYESPRNNLEIQLVKIWEDVLGIKPIGIKDNFFDLGGHSLLVMEIIDRIGGIFQKTLPVAMVFQYPTVELLGVVLRTEGYKVPWELIIPIRPSGSRSPFFCIHGAMTNLTKYVTAEQPFFSIMPHGMTGRRAPASIESMALEYIKQIRTIQPEGPYCLGGYSIGGLLAIEVARIFKNIGQQVLLLVLIDPTSIKDNKNIIDKKTAKSNFQKYKDNLHVLSVQLILNGIVSKHLFKEKLKYLFKWTVQKIRSISFGIRKRTKQIICELYLRSSHPIPVKLRRFYHSQASNKALKTYEPQQYSGNVDIIYTKARGADFELCWRNFIVGNVEFHEIPGDHFAILNEPHVQVLAKKLSNSLLNKVYND